MANYQQTAQNGESQSPALDLRTFLDNFWRALQHFWWIVVALAVVSSLFFWWRAYSAYVPFYQTTATFMVEADIGDDYSSSYYDSLTARQIQAVFPYVMSSELLTSAMQEKLELSYIPASISSSVAERSNMITITSTATDPNDAFRVAQVFLESFPDAVERIVGTTKMTMIDPPSLVEEPLNPRDPFNGLAKGLALGVGAGALLLVVLTLTKKTVQHTSDIARHTNLECLGQIYHVVRKKRKNKKEMRFTLLSKHLDYGFKEIFRSLSVRLERLFRGKNAKVMLITSTIPGEGKTMVSVNTALALAANGSRVVLLDCDLRRPTVRLQFGIQKEGPGVSEVLKGECSLNEALCEVDGTSLLILAGSSPAEDAAELIGSSQMEQLLQVLREGVDYIILDSPPAGLIADAASVSEYADLVLYVVRQNYCAARTVLQSIRHLSQSGGVFAGYVLNDVQSGITEAVSRYGYNGYNGHYYGKYGAYYGYGESREKERSEEPRTTYYTEDDA